MNKKHIKKMKNAANTNPNQHTLLSEHATSASKIKYYHGGRLSVNNNDMLKAS